MRHGLCVWLFVVGCQCCWLLLVAEFWVWSFVRFACFFACSLVVVGVWLVGWLLIDWLTSTRGLGLCSLRRTGPAADLAYDYSCQCIINHARPNRATDRSQGLL